MDAPACITFPFACLSAYQGVQKVVCKLSDESTSLCSGGQAKSLMEIQEEEQRAKQSLVRQQQNQQQQQHTEPAAGGFSLRYTASVPASVVHSSMALHARFLVTLTLCALSYGKSAEQALRDVSLKNHSRESCAWLSAQRTLLSPALLLYSSSALLITRQVVKATQAHQIYMHSHQHLLASFCFSASKGDTFLVACCLHDLSQSKTTTTI